jgi:hypothetical protein
MSNHCPQPGHFMSATPVRVNSAHDRGFSPSSSHLRDVIDAGKILAARALTGRLTLQLPARRRFRCTTLGGAVA